MKWIDIKHNKPELGLAVLVYLKSGIITTAYRKEIGMALFWNIFGDIDSITDFNNDEVLYWMKMPKPPKIKCEHELKETNNGYLAYCIKCGIDAP